MDFCFSYRSGTLTFADQRPQSAKEEIDYQLKQQCDVINLCIEYDSDKEVVGFIKLEDLGRVCDEN